MPGCRVSNRFAKQWAREHYLRRRRDGVAIKGILYTPTETAAFIEAARRVACLRTDFQGPECLMVGDSYLTTHLGRSTTHLPTPEDMAWFQDLSCGLLAGVDKMLDQLAPPRVYLLADLPDGSAESPSRALTCAQRFLSAGADAVKLEIEGETGLRCLEVLAHKGISVHAHIGFLPQKAEKRRRGLSVADCRCLAGLARAVRDAGADALVLEMVSRALNERLSIYHPRGLPVYSIFSGSAPGGGQSLNVWDAVVRPSFKARLFPPTATIDRAQVPEAYHLNLLIDSLQELMALTLDGRFPPPLREKWSPAELEALARLEPWA